MKETYGVPVEEIVQGTSKYGVRKINIDTDIRLAMTGAIRSSSSRTCPNSTRASSLKPAREAAKLVCKARFEAFGTAGNASKDQADQPRQDRRRLPRRRPEPGHPLPAGHCARRRVSHSGPELSGLFHFWRHSPMPVPWSALFSAIPWTDVIARRRNRPGRLKLWQKSASAATPPAPVETSASSAPSFRRTHRRPRRPPCRRHRRQQESAELLAASPPRTPNSSAPPKNSAAACAASASAVVLAAGLPGTLGLILIR